MALPRVARTAPWTAVLLCLALLQPGRAAGAEQRVLTLQQALSIALEKNRDVEKAREYARYVQGRYVEERAAALPQLSLNGAAAVYRDESQAAISGAAPRQYSRTLDLTLSQPLYSWGKISAGIRAAEVGLKTADEQLRLYRQVAFRDVTAAFYDTLLAAELHRFARQNLEQKQRLLDQAQRKFASGVATDYDVLAAEVAVENARPEVVRTENAIRTTRERLRFLLALDGQVEVAGALEAPTPDRPLPLTHEEAYATAVQKRPELIDARLRIGIYNELVTIAGAENKPRLDLRGSAGWHWLDLGSPTPVHNANGAAWGAGVYLTFPFFDGLRTQGRVAQAESDLRTRQLEEARLKDSVSLDVRIAVNALWEAAEIIRGISGTVRQAERLLQMAEKGYDFGVKIRLEVDDAQLNLLQARVNLARAQRDYRVARINYEWAIGVAGE